MNLIKLIRLNRKLLVVFLIYCASLFIFAFIYNEQYVNNSDSFAFNADVLKAQKEASNEAINLTKAQTQQALGQQQTELLAFSQLSQMLKPEDTVNITYLRSPTTLAVTPSAEIRTSDYRFVFHPGLQLNVQLMYFSISVDSYDKDGKELGSQEVPDYLTAKFPERGWQYQYLIAGVTHQLQAVLTQTQQHLTSLETTNSEVWTYWDFFYFSTVTQTTVGYGDMLPNRTAVRITVIFQVLFGILFLVVVINLSVSEITKPVRVADDRK